MIMSVRGISNCVIAKHWLGRDGNSEPASLRFVPQMHSALAPPAKENVGEPERVALVRV